MKTILFAASVCSACVLSMPLEAKEPAPAKSSKLSLELEAGTRLQVFLDRAEFGPGKIDGRCGEFTVKALALYRQAHGLGEPSQKSAPTPAPKGDQVILPDTTGLDLASVGEVFVSYTVTEDDVKGADEVPESVAAQAKLKRLPYRTVAEGIAEKFHTDVDFLAELNPGKTKTLRAGDVLKVPNVEPFQWTEVKKLEPGAEITPIAANDVEEEETEKDTPKKAIGKKGADKKPAEEIPLPIAVKVDTGTNMLSVYDGEKLLAAYPVTIGSAQTESPLGEWKVKGVAKMPNFRYDEAMLQRGERSRNFHLLPPGPNNPVGVIWIQLNKKGIGLHGTNDPDAIGRSASHGCVRLANWDVVRLAAKVKAGVPVSIH